MRETAARSARDARATPSDPRRSPHRLRPSAAPPPPSPAPPASARPRDACPVPFRAPPASTLVVSPSPPASRTLRARDRSAGPIMARRWVSLVPQGLGQQKPFHYV